jgi:hypothetical protein
VTEKEIDRMEASIEMPRRGIRMFHLPAESIHYLSRGTTTLSTKDVRRGRPAAMPKVRKTAAKLHAIVRAEAAGSSARGL